jgi:peptide/nickel transport system substrate-binding protein
MGVAQLSATNPTAPGLRQVSQILAVEALARPGEDGRMQPWLAKGWTSSVDGRTLTLQLRPGVKFHDGSMMDATTVAALLPDALRGYLGSASPAGAQIHATADGSVEINFQSGSPFLREALEAPVQKRNATLTGTGPYAVVPNSTTELRANRDYYLGPPRVDIIHVETFPSVRTAWAEMLRDRLDMLYEVGSDALDSMKSSSTNSVFTFTRKYQHVLVFNTEAPSLRSPALRRALNMAVDRTAVVRSALNDYGVASSGPIWPRYWALSTDVPWFAFDPRQAADTIKAIGRSAVPLRFTCLVSPDSLDGRIALEVKRQLAAVGIDMTVEEAPRDAIVKRGGERRYEAIITELLSGPTMLRPYMMWHSKGPFNWGRFGTPRTDATLDRVRHAESDADYRDAVLDLQRTFMADPPAIFLAWSQRARAVTKRFDVPSAEPGRDILSNLRLWKQVGLPQPSSRN